ncbi:ornithine cyclodeaminase family protein [Silvimonas sp.]|uniref:ornithine cyclodeaminase family protein n=1 Tax=Silvimonas sp. TaxID=2650811 RepID=UPI00283F8B51|nr:ornithine cyclodeaminase family protein [Silvimonas sp.]MDR3426134.1 ornithine cyclodeaminase family protein [Silvimonas sp.]
MNTAALCAPRIADAATVRALLPRLNVRQVLEDTFRALGQNMAVQPPQSLTLFPQDAGDFITYLGVLSHAGVFGAKLSPYIVTPGRPVITAWTTLISMQTGQPLLLCDSGQLTTERTAGATALAIDYLAPTHAGKLALIGSGAVGQAHLRHVASLREWSDISVFSPDLHADTERQATLQALDSRVQIATSAAACVNDADVVMLCTSSGTPVLDMAHLTKPALITSISTNVVRAHEIPPSALPGMDVYCDYKLTTPGSAGEMVIAAAEHGWSSASVVGDLADLVNQRCNKPDYQKHVFFRSIGLGLEDVAIAYALHQVLSA